MEPLVTENRVGVENDLGQVGEDVAGTKSVDTAWVINKKVWSLVTGEKDIPDTLESPFDSEGSSHVSHSGLCVTVSIYKQVFM